MPGDSYYWSPTENETDDSLVDKEPYIDPWDLENYAYIREHLDSMELSSSHSGPSGSSGEFAEPTNSFDYLPGKRAKPVSSSFASAMTNIREERFDSILSDQENYAAIEDIQQYEKKNRRAGSEMYYPTKRRMAYDYETEEDVSPYAEGIVQENSVFGIYDEKGMFRRVALPLSYKTRDRSLSYSYGDSCVEYNSRIHSETSTEEFPSDRRDTMYPIYDDVEKQKKIKPHFGFSKYGHLKIDYSCSWNNLNKFMKYN
ncbi:uncharacterized protein LOC130451121 [Diorhabda sublineata]|uniref:uncharacterized protein LOC130451121 n=1 Tax=Diorhabda sublineata TaxID=1163346 RepID=UPI0024E14FB7|nr:uncharacterized protein LOC130451121 [Diorhabda sublineata]